MPPRLHGLRSARLPQKKRPRRGDARPGPCRFSRLKRRRGVFFHRRPERSYRHPNQTRPAPTDGYDARAVVDHCSIVRPCEQSRPLVRNRKAQQPTNSGPTTRRTIFMTAPFDRKIKTTAILIEAHRGAMKKPPGHDARRPLLRLPVSQFRRYPSTTRVRPEGSTCKQKTAVLNPAASLATAAIRTTLRRRPRRRGGTACRACRPVPEGDRWRTKACPTIALRW
jgi:hypothetical protein